MPKRAERCEIFFKDEPTDRLVVVSLTNSVCLSPPHAPSSRCLLSQKYLFLTYFLFFLWVFLFFGEDNADFSLLDCLLVFVIVLAAIVPVLTTRSLLTLTLTLTRAP